MNAFTAALMIALLVACGSWAVTGAGLGMAPPRPHPPPRTGEEAAMTITEANDINTVLHWAMGHRVAWPGGPRITEEDATAAARRLTGRAQKSLLAGLGPDDVTLALPALLPAEHIAVTVARAQVARGENPDTTAMLLLTIGRLTGQVEVAAGEEAVSL